MRTRPTLKLARLAAVSLALLGASPQSRAQTSTASDRVFQMEQKLAMLSQRIAKNVQSLKDGQAIIAYYKSMTEQMSEYRQSIVDFEMACSNHERRYERMKSERSPFLNSAFLEVQNCRSDIPNFYIQIKSLYSSVNQIEIEVNKIEKYVEELGGAMPDMIRQQKSYQLSLKLRDVTVNMSDQLKEYRRTN